MPQKPMEQPNCAKPNQSEICATVQKSSCLFLQTNASPNQLMQHWVASHWLAINVACGWYKRYLAKQQQSHNKSSLDFLLIAWYNYPFVLHNLLSPIYIAQQDRLVLAVTLRLIYALCWIQMEPFDHALCPYFFMFSESLGIWIWIHWAVPLL